MDDELFINKLNEIVEKHNLKLPVLDSSEPLTGEISAWVRFLELCVKKGISLGDPRWRRLTVTRRDPHTVFSLEGGLEAPPDTDFRVGLQLLLSGLHDGNSSK
jgi:hypothetical protein